MVFSGPLAQWYPLRRWALGVGIAISAACGLPAEARERAPEATIAVAELPAEARAVHRLVRSGGPFAHVKDGAVFGNRERSLPTERRGYYREYTVPTPGARDRGARRIVCGGLEPRAPETCFYTPDHYRSFRRISP